MKLLLRTGLTLLLSGCLLTSAPAFADIACDIGAARGKSLPSSTAPKNSGQFNIFWQISTQIEDIADAADNPANMKDIKEAKALVDGYFFNTLLGGPLTYWPDRPEHCRLNYKKLQAGDTVELDGETYTFEQGRADREDCTDEQKKFVSTRSSSRDAVRDVQIDALERVFGNLDLAGERQKGKQIWGVSIIRNTDFSYDKQADKVAMQKLPNTYCVLNASNLMPDQLMIYQENRQSEKGLFVWVPRENRRGKLVYSKTPRLDKIPENTRAFDMFTDAFREAEVPVGGFRANIRRWNPRWPERVRDLAADKDLTGFNFEGGTRILVDKKKDIDNFAEGIAWILSNTDRDVSILMPGYWAGDMMGNDEEIDDLIPRVRQTVVTLNDKLTGRMKGQNALCTGRITLIVGSYGRPVHVKPLPIRRGDGRLAGTVAGQIKLLSDLRKEMCSG